MSTTTDSITDTVRAATAEAARILTAPARRAAALTYLRQRGINGDALPEAWPLGYAPPGWTRLTDTLLADGFTEQTLLDAGLAHRSSRGTLIDVFRDRVIFPIHDHAGQVAGFIGRDLSGAPAAPKYVNTRETPLFSKGTLLYGLHEARATSPQACRPVLVEGPLDVLALTARAQVTGDADLLPVATCGTAVTPTQARLIVETAATYNVPVVVAMDGDSAGRSATLTAGEQLRRHGLDVLVAVLPNGTDPAEYTANPDRSLNVFRQSGALPLLTAQVQNCIAVQGDRMQWVEGRLAAARHIADILTSHPPAHAIAQTSWISTVLDIAPSTFATVLGTAFVNAHSLPPAGTRTGDLLRAAVDPRQIGVASRSNLTEEAPAPTCAPTLTQ
jgi:DNA primase